MTPYGLLDNVHVCMLGFMLLKSISFPKLCENGMLNPSIFMQLLVEIVIFIRGMMLMN